ncbi:hypothetical protein H0H92_003610 [Tricholoma furcatifolium]|nr:hypothetical protein H0H92_003610 [Tricholoma furcatifolium]
MTSARATPAVQPSALNNAPQTSETFIDHDGPAQLISDSDEMNDGEELLEDGIGDDNGEEDVDGSDLNADAVDVPSTSQVLLRPLPTWLKTTFDKYVGNSAQRGQGRLPPLYRDHKTFWFPKPATFFILQDTRNLSPEQLYDIRFFLWDPECLVPGGIVCPNKGCTARLQRYCHIPRPRRVVDFGTTFYIIGYRYRCRSCKSPNNVTFRSWDERILRVLPPELEAEFPANLSYRSGISRQVSMFMRTSAQHGTGMKQFSNALLVQHLQNYDILHLQYLYALAPKDGSLHSSGPFARTFNSFLPFHDKSSHGLHGFVPSAQYLRDIYDTVIEQHQAELNQHMAMLTGHICAIDHSFKLAKQIAKIDGIQVFTALLTVTNEKGEIRICNLVATKAHAQFELALAEMRKSLILFGHDEPCLFYSDNMSDKEFLEKTFPSLLQDVVPIEKYSHLQPLTISDDCISVKRSTTAINDAMRTILDLLPDDDSETQVVIGLDSEWNVETSERGYVTGRGQTAILQIAVEKKVYILQIGQMLAGSELPLVLKQVLTNPRIIKVGRCVASDLKYLEQVCRSDIPFVGGIDIASLAKKKLVVSSARVSLSDLCAIVLNRCLKKNVSERTSCAWEEEELTRAQIRYAALDAWASLLVYHVLVSIPTPVPLCDILPEAGTSVLLYASDKSRPAAQGTVSAHSTTSNFKGINLTPSQCVIEVSKILIPAAIISNGTRGISINKRSLQSFGQPPFNLVCLRSHVRLSSMPNTPQALAISDLPTPHAPQSIRSISPTVDQQPAIDMSNITGDHLSESPSLQVTGTSPFGHILSEALASFNSFSAERQDIANYISDPSSVEEGKQIFDAINLGWVDTIRSRVLKDAFHVFNMLYLPAAHGLIHEFAIALRDAIFIWDQTDKDRIIAWGQVQDPPLSWNEILFTRSTWLLRRCKRIIPPAEQLLPVVAEVFKIFGPLKDAKTGVPLFNPAAWAVAKNILLLIQKGHLSDPPGIPLYYQVGIDIKTGLVLYRCMRGTNMTEGGVHTHLRSRLPSSGVSIRHSHLSLLDFIIRHNLLVGTFNSTGKPFIGHYSIWITNKLQEMLALVGHMLVNPREPGPPGWVNGNLYQIANETAGVLPIPRDIQVKLSMGPYVPGLHSKQRHQFLAARQGTRKPILPVHNAEERRLFHKFMTDNSGFNDPETGPNWSIAVPLWNNVADTEGPVSYKLTEQLKAYYNEWKKNVNIKQTKSMTADKRVKVTEAIRDPRRSLAAPKALEVPQTLHSVTQGLRIAPNPENPKIPASSTRSPNVSHSESVLTIRHEKHSRIIKFPLDPPLQSSRPRFRVQQQNGLQTLSQSALPRSREKVEHAENVPTWIALVKRKSACAGRLVKTVERLIVGAVILKTLRKSVGMHGGSEVDC